MGAPGWRNLPDSLPVYPVSGGSQRAPVERARFLPGLREEMVRYDEATHRPVLDRPFRLADAAGFE